MASRASLAQQQDSCTVSGTSGTSCQLADSTETAAYALFEACRTWGTAINRFGPQHDDLRALYDNKNNMDPQNVAFFTTSAGVRVWPYRPHKGPNTQNLGVYGLRSYTKCNRCFTTSNAELIDSALVQYG